MQTKRRYILFAALGLAACAVVMAARRPAMFSNPRNLGALILLEIVAFCVWRYESRFFPFLVGVFVWAGCALPLKDVASEIRWVILAAASGIGFVLWMRAKHYKLGAFHAVAFVSLMAALVSSLGSTIPAVASLKVASLAMLFLYGATGARVAFWLDPARFISSLIVGFEILVFVSGIAYLILKAPVFGNPNSLGAVMAFAAPVLFWDVLMATPSRVRSRRIIAVCLSAMLLYTSAARAAILAAAFATVLLCIILRRTLILPKVALASLLLISLAGVLEPSRFPDFIVSVTGNLIYKQKGTVGVFDSRINPWNQALGSIKKHPWFGSGFGTTASLSVREGPENSLTRSNRVFEYGNSYLEVLDYTGLGGALSFGALVFLLAWRAAAVSAALRKNDAVTSYAIPLLMAVTVGLIHAGFEDWLFAPGSYVCIFFWSCAFLLMDFAPAAVSPSKVRMVRNAAIFRPAVIGVGAQDLQVRRQF